MGGRRLLLAGGLGLLAVIVVAQLLPFGRDHTNPPVRQDAPWPDDRSRALARTACYDCHSNQTEWPFYSYVAPFSWLVTSDVRRGRSKLNFSEWGAEENNAHDAAETVQEGSMPPTRYVLTHPHARLSDADRQALIAALEAMDEGNRGPGGGDGGGNDGGQGGDDRSGSGDGGSGSGGPGSG